MEQFYVYIVQQNSVMTCRVLGQGFAIPLVWPSSSVCKQRQNVQDDIKRTFPETYTSSNLVSKACFSSCKASRLSASNFVLPLNFESQDPAEMDRVLTKHIP